MKESKNKSNFCIRPFNSALITTTGNLKICCKIDTKLTKFKNFKESNVEKDTIEQWWISDYNNYVRQSFLENKKIKAKSVADGPCIQIPPRTSKRIPYKIDTRSEQYLS